MQNTHRRDTQHIYMNISTSTNQHIDGPSLKHNFQCLVCFFFYIGCLFQFSWWSFTPSKPLQSPKRFLLSGILCSELWSKQATPSFGKNDGNFRVKQCCSSPSPTVKISSTSSVTRSSLPQPTAAALVPQLYPKEQLASWRSWRRFRLYRSRHSKSEVGFLWSMLSHYE